LIAIGRMARVSHVHQIFMRQRSSNGSQDGQAAYA
jgi:hypothetical protein